MLEYKLWLNEQSAEWVEIVKKKTSDFPLTGANSVCLGSGQVRKGQPARVHHEQAERLVPHQSALNSKIQKPIHVQQMAFKDLKWPAVSQAKGILGPIPIAKRASAGVISGPFFPRQSRHGPTCHSCGQSGNHSR